MSKPIVPFRRPSLKPLSTAELTEILALARELQAEEGVTRTVALVAAVSLYDTLYVFGIDWDAFAASFGCEEVQ